MIPFLIAAWGKGDPFTLENIDHLPQAFPLRPQLVDALGGWGLIACECPSVKFCKVCCKVL